MKIKKTVIVLSLVATCLSFVLVSKLKNPGKHHIPVIHSVDSAQKTNDRLKGKVCIVSYFQTWCSDCVKEQPELLKLQERFGKDSLRILMISDESADKIRAFKVRFNSSLDFYHTDLSLKRDIGITAYPTTFLLDRKQNVVIKKIEGINWYTPEVIAEIGRLVRD